MTIAVSRIHRGLYRSFQWSFGKSAAVQAPNDGIVDERVDISVRGIDSDGPMWGREKILERALHNWESTLPLIVYQTGTVLRIHRDSLIQYFLSEN